MEILYQNANFLVCIKPARVLSTDEPGGLPELVREALGDPKADVRTVHRLDRVVSGVMVLARNARAASELSRQIREDQFSKEYLAVVHGRPESPEGTLRDLLARDKARRMTFVADALGKGALAFLCVVNTALACYLYFSSMNRLSARSVALLGYIDPVSALVFAALFLGESMSAVQVAGAVLVLAGAAWGQSKARGERL